MVKLHVKEILQLLLNDTRWRLFDWLVRRLDHGGRSRGELPWGSSKQVLCLVLLSLSRVILVIIRRGYLCGKSCLFLDHLDLLVAVDRLE